MYETGVRNINCFLWNLMMKNNGNGGKSAKTKSHILNVSERLFANKGFDFVSIRDITENAKISLSAVNYHFGNKEGLIAAIFERRLTPLNKHRLDLLEAAEKAVDNRVASLEDILKAFVVPVFRKEFGCNNAILWKLLGKCLADSNQQISKMLQVQLRPIKNRFDSAIARANPKLSREEVFWRMSFIVAALQYYLLIMGQAIPRPTGIEMKEEVVVKRLVTYGVVVMNAPLLDKTNDVKCK